MKKIVVIVPVFLLLGGVVGGLTAMGKGPLAEFLAEQKKAKEEKAAGKAAEAPPPSVFFDLGTYVVPVMQGKTLVRQVGFDMVVEVDPSAKDKVAAAMPRLQNTVNLGLNSIVPGHMDIENPGDKEAIRAYLTARANMLFGQGSIRDIVIKSMYYR